MIASQIAANKPNKKAHKLRCNSLDSGSSCIHADKTYSI